MIINPFRQIAQSSEAVLLEQFASLRTQIPLMYALMTVNAAFLAFATYGDVPNSHSIGGAVVLCLIVAIRAIVWIARPATAVSAAKIRRYLRGTIVASVLLSGAFGGWGLLLLSETDPSRSAAIALYVFVGAISCCYCLQAFPVAGWFVLLFGALPVTIKLLLSKDWYLVATGVDFLVAGGVILRSLANSHTGFVQLLQSRIEMSSLIAALKRSQEHYRYSVELNPQIPWLSDAGGALTELSPRWCELTGISLRDGLGWGWLQVVHPDDLEDLQIAWLAALNQEHGEPADARYRLRLTDGSFRWFRARAFPRRGEDGKVIAWYGNLEDIDDQVVAELALQESEERYRLASQAANDIIWDLSLERNHIDWSSAAATVLGYPGMLMGTTRDWWVERIHPEDREQVLTKLSSALRAGLSHWVEEFRAIAANGAELHLISHGYVVRDGEGKPTRVIGSLQDVTRQKLYEAKLEWAAHYDALTELPNRVMFNERLEAALKQAEETGRKALLVVLDIDRFKAINDDWGHDAGDALLQEVASRLRRMLPEGSTAARLGGDEFAIILPDIKPGSAVELVVEQLLSDIMGPAKFEGRQFDISVSAGAALGLADGRTTREMHKSADLALYAAKKDGVGRLRWFRNELREAARRETLMLHDARTALSEDRIIPYYQPKICLRTGACVGFEALLRWHHRYGLRPPASIAAALEDPGLSVQLTDRMLDRVIGDVLYWRDIGVDVGLVAINGSAGDFRQGDFADRILGRLSKAGLPASIIELEVTETVFVSQHVKNVEDILNSLSQAGATIALDDFGTGYASLTHLKQFPVDTIKIDRSFISRTGKAQPEDNAIVRAVIGLAKSLGISTVAEGIETPEQAARLAKEGCDLGQGFLFGRPMPASKVADVLTSWDPTSVRAVIDGRSAL
jgi:diguanylate cyclase (GGDEF)-like protein/PAS domain S-box-containing protein